MTVDRPGRKPCCSSMRTERFANGRMSFKTKASNILDMWLSITIGLQFSISEELLDFGIGVSELIFQISGNIPKYRKYN